MTDCTHNETYTNEYAGTTWCKTCRKLLDVRIEE